MQEGHTAAERLFVSDPRQGDAVRNFPDETLVAWTAMPLLAPLDDRTDTVNCALSFSFFIHYIILPFPLRALRAPILHLHLFLYLAHLI